MRFKLFSGLSILLLVGFSHARPSKLASPEVIEEIVEKKSSKVVVDDSSSWRPFEPRNSSVVKTDSRNEPDSVKRKTKDLQYMDQSLRTVATQLLNVTNPNESIETRVNHKNVKIEMKPTKILLVEKRKSENSDNKNLASKEKSDMELVREINSEMSSLGSMGVNFGRPVNSKFGYLESSHPGQAMAMTEEELERELMASSSTRLITAHKNHPTTTGGISTWILLNNPPTTTTTTTGKPSSIDVEKNNEKEVKVEINLQQAKLTTPVKIFETKTATTLEKIASPQFTSPMERITTLTKNTTPSLKKTTTGTTQSMTEKPLKINQTTLKMEKIKVTQTTPFPKILTSGSSTTIKQENSITTPKSTITTNKIGNSNRSTVRPKTTSPKFTNVTAKPITTKQTKPTRKISTKSPMESTKNPSTSKIEKVTFRPVHMITTPKSNIVERPIFVTKVKSSFSLDSPSSKTSNLSINNTAKNEETKLNSSDNKLVGVSMKIKKSPIKTNNVLKVQLKKPTDSEPTRIIEISSTEVNEPILKIEEKSKLKSNLTKDDDDSMILDDSLIDLKFDFNPELTRIDVERLPVTIRTTTTKRPHKQRKKTKLRRRKPTTVAPVAILPTTTLSTTQNPSTIFSTSENIDESVTEIGIVDNSIQESKIVAESKVTTGSLDNNTKNKKKQVQKPIGTQIYNFLSREVIPSFGVMSLVGLGLGLASYFLYPFSGTIARRNYIVEPNYKYNMDEYGGNYGQNEEEVFSKVLQGMTNQDGKYGGIKDYENNYYRYQQHSYDGPYTDGHHTTTKRIAAADQLKYSTVSAATINHNRPHETTIYDNTKYKNTEFKYPEISTTPNYYEMIKKPAGYLVKTLGDRQFVVGNIPKEYAYDDKNMKKLSITTENSRTNIDENIQFGNNPVNISPYEHAEAFKSNGDYDDELLEITPSAVAVEHGPRSLIDDAGKLRRRRRKRDSVIQLIPSRTEIEKEEEEIEKEEPLSNEILDIIDSVIPAEMDHSDNDKKIINSEINQIEKKHTLEKKASGDEITKNQIGTMSDEKKIKSEITTTEKIQVTETSTSQASTTDKIIDSTLLNLNSTSTTSTSTTSTSTTSGTSTTIQSLTIDEINGPSTKSSGKHPESSSIEWFDQKTTVKPHHEEQPFNIFNFVKKIAEVKLRLGVAIMKHASEGFARYLGHVQKRINGEE